MSVGRLFLFGVLGSKVNVPSYGRCPSFAQGVNYKEALKVLKLVVTRSSTLVAPPTSNHHIYWDSHATASRYSFADIDVFTKKELPGKARKPTLSCKNTCQ